MRSLERFVAPLQADSVKESGRPFGESGRVAARQFDRIPHDTFERRGLGGVESRQSCIQFVSDSVHAFKLPHRIIGDKQCRLDVQALDRSVRVVLELRMADELAIALVGRVRTDRDDDNGRRCEMLTGKECSPQRRGERGGVCCVGIDHQFRLSRSRQ